MYGVSLMSGWMRTKLTAELVKRRQLHGTYSPPTSDEESEEAGPSSGIRQGGKPRTRKVPRSRRNSNVSSLTDDPCGVRKKRTFFKSAPDVTTTLARQIGLNVPLSMNGLMGDVTPEVLLNGGLGSGNGNGNGSGGANGDGMVSRAGSPMSVV